MTRPLPPIRIRSLVEEDGEAFHQVQIASFPPSERRLSLANDVNSEGALCLGAIHLANGALVGYLLGRVHDDVVSIESLAVLPEHRGRQVARHLMIAVLEEARSRGVRRATLDVRKGNRAARKLYEGLGFHAHGVRTRYYSDPVEDALILWLDDLDGPETWFKLRASGARASERAQHRPSDQHRLPDPDGC